MKFKKGNLVGTLQRTNVEVCVSGNYLWRHKLALLADDGSWLYSSPWNSKKAARGDLEESGWELLKTTK